MAFSYSVALLLACIKWCLGRQVKLYYLRVLTALYLAVSGTLHGSLSSHVIHYHSLPGSSDQHLSPQEKWSGSEELGKLEWVVSSQAAPPCSQHPTRVSRAVASLHCHQNEWLSPHVSGTARTRKGSNAPLRSRKCDPLHPYVSFGQSNILEVD